MQPAASSAAQLRIQCVTASAIGIAHRASCIAIDLIA
jgi:hypothetical protein